MDDAGKVFGICHSRADGFGMSYVTRSIGTVAPSPARALVYMDMNRVHWFGADTALTSEACAVLLERFYGYHRVGKPDDRRSVIWTDLCVEGGHPLREGGVGDLKTLLADPSLHREELRLDMLPFLRPLSEEAGARLTTIEDQEIWSKPFDGGSVSGTAFAGALLDLWEALPEAEQERILANTKLRDRPH